MTRIYLRPDEDYDFTRQLLDHLGVDASQVARESITIEPIGDGDVQVKWTGMATMPAADFGHLLVRFHHASTR